MRSILRSYRELVETSWADQHPDLATRAESWPSLGLDGLEREIETLLVEAARPPREVRVFWKWGDDLTYLGLNAPFAADAGFSSPQAMIGRTDFDSEIPWTRQAAKYQADDRDVMARGEIWPYILERQERESGVEWLHTGKSPIRDQDGTVIGLLGMYETIDSRRAMEIRRKSGQLD
ncbi:MAG: PAS domain-containing protein [Acidobacteriota bacterium]